MRLAELVRGDAVFPTDLGRYAFSVLSVAVALALSIALKPLTGEGVPFVLFFGATLATSFVAGVGPALLSVAIGAALGAALYVVAAGYTVAQAAVQASLYAADGFLVICITVITDRRRLALQEVNRQLQRSNEERAKTLAAARETIELSPDAYFLADLDARFTDVNQAACRLLGYERDDLIGKTIFDIIRPADAPRLKAIRAELMVPARVSQSEWTLKRKDGTLVPVDVSSNILPDGRWQAFVRDISERKRIEDVRQVYVALLDNSSDFIGIADPAGKPIYVNPAGRRMVGLEPDFPVERTSIQEYYPPELRGFVANIILKAVTDHGQWSGETQFQNFRTHETIPVSDAHFRICDPSGERVLGIGTVTRDISEARRIAEEREELLAHEHLARQEAESANRQLRESEERFRLTIDNAPIGMALVALDGHWVRVNQALCEITGYSADELMKLTYQDITHHDDLDTDVELAGKAARGEIPRYNLEKRYIRKDGTMVDVMLSVSVLRGPDGEALYYISQMEDITVRKRAEEALRLSEAKFSGIVSIAADAIISVDKDQRITIFNEGAEAIFGYTKDEVMGTPLDCLIPERFRAVHREHFAGFVVGEEAARTMAERKEIFGRRKNGEEFPAEGSISRITVGGMTFFSVVLRDVTYRKSAEEALHRAVAARDDVLGIVAHDLRNPLTTILMQAQLLEHADPKVERRDQTARLVITRSAKRMNALIQDLLDVAMVEAGQFKVERERLSAAEVVRETVEAQTPVASAAGLELRLEIERGVDHVLGDRNRLLQVFDNIIGNAIKFTPKGGHIAVSATARGGDVLFSIADSGAGIAPESVPHIFDRFWQATTREGRLGAGLGLPITKGVVEAHGGRIWVESTVGRGTTFFFTIPAAPAETSINRKDRDVSLPDATAA